MNVGDLYIDCEITDKFFYLLSFYDKLNLTKCCKASFKRYKDIIRHEAFAYINDNYVLFHECLRRFKYTKNEQIKLMDLSMNVLPIQTTSGIFMDIRFIFEICFHFSHPCFVYKSINNNTKVTLVTFKCKLFVLKSTCYVIKKVVSNYI